MTVQTHLGTTLPIIQAPMAGVQGSALTIAVSNAGGLGSLACAMLTPDALLKELQAIKAGTDRPYNLNFFCHTQPEQSSEREQAWRATLAPYYAEFGIDPETIPSAAGRAPFTTATADLIEPFKPPVISFHFGLPDPTLLARIKAWGTQVLSSATTVEEAQWLEAAGVDAVIAQGLEAGGHRGMFLSDDITTQTGTFALVRRIVRAVDIPVIAAGGIADAEGVAAAMTLGAAGVQIGTAYLLCPEASTSAVHRAALQSPDAAHTAPPTCSAAGQHAASSIASSPRWGPCAALHQRFRWHRLPSRHCVLRPRRSAVARFRRCGAASTHRATRIWTLPALPGHWRP